MSTSAPRPDRLNRITRPLEQILAGRGSRMAEPVRALVVGLLFCFLIWRLRRLAGMLGNGASFRPKTRPQAAVRALCSEEYVVSAASEAEPETLGPEIPPPAEPGCPNHPIPDNARYGKHLLRLLQQAEMRALLDASPHLKPSLRRLLRLMGEKIPPELAPLPRPPQPALPTPPTRSRAAQFWNEPVRPAKLIANPALRAMRWPPDRPSLHLKSAVAPTETRVHFVTN